MTNEMRQVSLPVDLCVEAERIYGKRFGTLEQLLVYVIEQLVRDDAAKMDQEEQRIIEDRLRDLGYI